MPRPMVIERMVAVKALNAMPNSRIDPAMSVTDTRMGKRLAMPSVASPSMTQ